MASVINYQKHIKSPLNYIGGKQKILPQILPLFPNQINTFVDLFVGGGNVAVNVAATKVLANDNLTFLIEMYKAFQQTRLLDTIQYVESQIHKYQLSLTNEEGYKELRRYYNQHKNPLDLFVLIAFSFNHQIRFNNNHEFNNPFGKDRSCFNSTMKQNLQQFINRIQSQPIEFTAQNFDKLDFTSLNSNDFVYCDPPYLITSGTYNDGKRGFTGWSIHEEKRLLQILDKLNTSNIKFALSNVLEHKGKTNEILSLWLKNNPNYLVNFIKKDYANANYQTIVRDKDASTEVLITNYKPTKPQINTLF